MRERKKKDRVQEERRENVGQWQCCTYAHVCMHDWSWALSAIGSVRVRSDHGTPRSEERASEREGKGRCARHAGQCRQRCVGWISSKVPHSRYACMYVVHTVCTYMNSCSITAHSLIANAQTYLVAHRVLLCTPISLPQLSAILSRAGFAARPKQNGKQVDRPLASGRPTDVPSVLQTDLRTAPHRTTQENRTSKWAKGNGHVAVQVR